jgi:hypothetical protein
VYKIKLVTKKYISQAWGNLSKYNKVYVHDFEHLERITAEQYDYNSYKHTNGVYQFIDSNKPYKHGGIARLFENVPFLTFKNLHHN